MKYFGNNSVKQRPMKCSGFDPGRVGDVQLGMGSGGMTSEVI